MPAILAFLKQKVIIFGIILALAIIGGGVWFARPIRNFISNGASKNSRPEITVTIPSRAITESPDSDGDGLKDWEEQLWGTDPNNPDTDGDKTSDGEEIRLGRNPLVTGPEDLLTSALPSKVAGDKTKTPDQTATEPLTLTDQLARDFLENYLRLKGLADGSELKSEERQSILESLLYNLPLINLPNSYSLSKISTFPANDKETIFSYLKEVGGVILGSQDIKVNELVVVRDALTREDENELRKLAPIIAAYENAVKNLLSIKAPEKYARLHLDLANSINNLRRAIILMQNFFKDPVQGLLATTFFNEESDKLGAALEGFQKEAQKDGLIFIAITDE